MDLLWFVIAVGAILIGGLIIGLGMVWLIGKLGERRGGGDGEAGVTPGPLPAGPPSGVGSDAGAVSTDGGSGGSDDEP